MEDFSAMKRFGGLRPIDQIGMDVLAKLPEGREVIVKAVMARNGKQHRLFWALVGLLYQQQTRYATSKQLSNAIKCAVGYCDEVETKSGKVLVIPHSMAYHAMSQASFNEFFDRVIDLVVTQILPGVSDAELRAELEDMTR